MNVDNNQLCNWMDFIPLSSFQANNSMMMRNNQPYLFLLRAIRVPNTRYKWDTWPGGLTQEETNKCRSIPVLEIGGFLKNLFINRRRSQMQTQTSLPTRFIVTERGTFLHIQSTSSPSGALGKIISFFAISPLPHRPRRIPNGSRSRGFIDQIVLRNGQFLGRRSKHLTEWL